MKKMTNPEIQNDILQILLEFDKFCKDNNLYYSLSGGTLLGAIRHKGFIPWDNDIDVCMPRPDYDRLIRTFPLIYKNRYRLRCFERGTFSKPFIKIVDQKTLVKEAHMEFSGEDALWIDVMPVDGLPDDKKETASIYKKAKLLRSFGAYTSYQYDFYASVWWKKIFKPFVIFLFKLIGHKVFYDRLDKLGKKYPYDNFNYVGAITWGCYGVNEKMKKKEFENSTVVEFEGHMFPAFSCWDKYLRNLYGDYMELPPVEKRISHQIEAYWKDE